MTKIIPASAGAQRKEQIAECRRFRGLTRVLEIGEQPCDAKLTASERH